MDKSLYALLNPSSSKGQKKLSIETKITISQPQHAVQPQSTKGVSKVAANTISTYRLMQYVFLLNLNI